MNKLFILLLLLIFSAASTQGLFEESLTVIDTSGSNHLQLNGFVKSTAYLNRQGNNNTVHMQSIYSQFGLIANVNADKYGAAYADFRYRSGIDYGIKLSEIELREAYADLYLGPLDIRVGKQIITWGATSFINPSDQFSPQNPTYRSPVLDDLRIGTWAISSNLAINSNSKFQMIWMPVYTPSVLLSDPFNFPEYITFGDDISPGMEIREGSFGLKYDLRSSILDLQLSYFNGYRNTPSIQTDTAIFNFTTLRPELIQLIKAPYRINSVGVNLTVPLGAYLFRAETAWMKPFENEELDLPFSELSYTAEIEQSGENITLIGGYYGKYIIKFVAPEIATVGITDEFPDVTALFPPGTPLDPSMLSSYIETQISGFNRLYNYQNKEFYHAAYASVSVSLFYDLIDIKLPVIYNFTSGELTLMPSLKINITDGLSFQMGAYYLYGKGNSIYKLVSPVLNAAYGLLQYKF